MDYASTQPTSGPSESVFSILGHIKNTERFSMKSENVNLFTCLRQNWEAFDLHMSNEDENDTLSTSPKIRPGPKPKHQYIDSSKISRLINSSPANRDDSIPNLDPTLRNLTYTHRSAANLTKTWAGAGGTYGVTPKSKHCVQK